MKTVVQYIRTSHTECVTPDVLQFINNVWILITRDASNSRHVVVTAPGRVRW